jgi:hypothetical protein
MPLLLMPLFSLFSSPCPGIAIARQRHAQIFASAAAFDYFATMPLLLARCRCRHAMMPYAAADGFSYCRRHMPC